MGVKIFPMGAKQAKEKFVQLMEDDNYIAQEKIDGVRGLLYVNQNGKVSVTTRGESVSAPGVPIDITHRIPMLKSWTAPAALCGTLIDCEITIPGLDSAQIAGVISHKSTVHIPEGMVFNCFDILAAKFKYITNKPLKERLETLRDYQCFYPSWVEFLPSSYGMEEKYDLLHSLWAEGKEGIMLKNWQGIYVPDKKPSNNWYKVKKVDNEDAKIIGSAPPEMYYRDPVTNKTDENRITKPYERGWFGALVYQLEDGSQGTVSGFSDLEKELMSDGRHGVKPEYIGRWMELRFMEKTKNGLLRHPRFIRLREEVEK